jgi:peptidoglycan/LPS O-acetylase OafA/YrhL
MAFLIGAAGISQVFPVTDKDSFIHRFCWLVLHPAWGVGFFIIVNRVFAAEQKWRRILSVPRAVEALAWVGLSSYSLYLTHSLVIMQSWRFTLPGWPPLLNALLITTPATVAFAWIFFQLAERPFMAEPTITQKAASEPMFSQTLVPQPEE